MADEIADVVIIGAGAAGAAVAWSLAETRMRVVCLEQGGWMDPAQYPTTRPDWELHGLGPFGFTPNTRGRREDYPVNDNDSPIKVSNFNAVGGSTILYAAHFPRLHPSDFRVKTLDGVAASRRPRACSSWPTLPSLSRQSCSKRTGSSQVRSKAVAQRFTARKTLNTNGRVRAITRPIVA
jgi:choline dehydrogenase-like flavoprotein